MTVVFFMAEVFEDGGKVGPGGQLSGGHGPLFS
jgi:hypothetical protein